MINSRLAHKSYLKRSCLNRVIKTSRREWERGAGNHGALNANRKLLGGGGRKHIAEGEGIYEQVTDVTRMPSTAPPPSVATRPLYTVTAAFNTVCLHQNKACCKIVTSIGISYFVFKYPLKILLTQYILNTISYGRCKINIRKVIY